MNHHHLTKAGLLLALVSNALSTQAQGPGGLSTTGLWYKSNAGVTTGPTFTWLNYGNISGANATQTVAASQPQLVNTTAGSINFNPVLSFDGTDDVVSTAVLAATDFFDITPVTPPLHDASQYIVYRRKSAGAGTLYNQSDGNGTPYNVGAKNDGTLYQTNSGATAPTIAVGEISLLGLKGVTSLNSESFIATKNGSTTGWTNMAAGFSVSGSQKFWIGAEGLGSFTNTDIAEIITFPFQLTTNAENAVRTYLAIKYGITLSHDYLASDQSTTLYSIAGYDSHIAGIGRDDASSLVQKQSKSSGTGFKDDMITIGLGTIAATNDANLNTFNNNSAYLIWGDNNTSATQMVTADIPLSLAGNCATRLLREWKMQNTSTMSQSTQVKADLNAIPAAVGIPATDIVLMIDRDGDGNFFTGSTTTITASSYSAGVATFDNVNWDIDSDGTDMFTILFNKIAPVPTLLATSFSQSLTAFGCPDDNGFIQFTDNIAAPTYAYVKINPNGNTGYNFSVTAINDNGIGNKMATDGATSTTAFSNRAYIINDAGSNDHTINGGMTVRLYYNPSDSTDAVNALDPAILPTHKAYRWFKYSGSNMTNLLNAQNQSVITGAVQLIPAYGMEQGIHYVEFSGIQNFSIFGSIAGAAAGVNAAPLPILSFDGSNNACETRLTWGIDQPLKHFNVEKSGDGKTFESVAQIAPIAGQDQYQYSLKQSSGTQYYRIRLTEADGQVSYSKVKAVQSQCGALNQLTVFPSLVSGNSGNLTARVQTGSEGMHTIKMLDLTGRTLHQQNWQNQPGQEKTLTISLNGIVAGTYIIQVLDAQNQLVAAPQRIVVQ